MSRSNGLGKMFFIGGLIGAGLALLYAPKSGKETRKGLRRGLHKANEKAHDLRDQAEDILMEGRKKAKALRHQAADILDEAKATADQLISKVK
jgi:gas vesicle protein